MLPPSRRASGPTSETGRKWTPAAFPHTAWLLLVGLYKHASLKVLRACLPLLIPLWVPTPTPFRADPGSKDPVTVLPQLQIQHLSLAQRPLELVCNMRTRMQAAWPNFRGPSLGARREPPLASMVPITSLMWVMGIKPSTSEGKPSTSCFGPGVRPGRPLQGPPPSREQSSLLGS